MRLGFMKRAIQVIRHKEAEEIGIFEAKERCVRSARCVQYDSRLESEDSSTLNTSFIERLNLTLRQACAYLTRRTTCHARGHDQLDNQLEIVRCHYNFLRPHRALRFGKETRTPAMQAGLLNRRFSFREVFLTRLLTIMSRMVQDVMVSFQTLRTGIACF